jgi:nucleotide-binding universal stress UspA family protein
VTGDPTSDRDPTGFANLIVGVDGRPGGRDAIALARELAGPGGRITLVHVHGGFWQTGPAEIVAEESDRGDSHRLLAAEREAAGLDAELISVRDHPPGRGLMRLAEQRSPDVVVIGSAHRGLLGRVLLGDQTRNALNGAPCALAIAPLGYGARTGRLGTIGVGYDGSPESELALEMARALAARHGSKLKALAVVSLQSIPYGEPIPDNWPDVAKQLVDDELRRLHGLDDVDGDVTYGDPGEELARFAKDLDLLVVGSRGYGPVDRLFEGSTSNYLARRAACPLLVLPRRATKTKPSTGSEP